MASFIVVGILLSYLPQHWRIVFRRSSEGLSPYYVLLGTTSGTCAFANVLTLPASQRALGCCKELDGLECAAGVLGIAQIGVQWACFTIMLALPASSMIPTQLTRLQPLPLSRLLSAGNTTHVSIAQGYKSDIRDCDRGFLAVHAASGCRLRGFPLYPVSETGIASRLGQFFGNFRYSSSSNSILAADLDHMAVAGSWKP